MPDVNSTESTQLAIEELYDAIMSDIEPDLLTYMIPELPSLYANETEDQKQQRATRYAKAFDEFAKRFKKIVGVWKDEFSAFRSKVMEQVKLQNAETEQTRVTEIESSFDDKK